MTFQSRWGEEMHTCITEKPQSWQANMVSNYKVQAVEAKRREREVEFWAQSHAVWKESFGESTTSWILGEDPGVVRTTRRQPPCSRA